MLHPTRAGDRDSSPAAVRQANHSSRGNRGSPRPPDGHGVSRLPPSLSAASVTPTLQLEETPSLPPTLSPPPVSQPPREPQACATGNVQSFPLARKRASEPPAPRPPPPPLRSPALQGVGESFLALPRQILQPVFCHLLRRPAQRDALLGWDGLGASGYHYHLVAAETVRRPLGHFLQ